VLNLTFDEADRLPMVTELDRPQLFKKGEIEATIQPRVMYRSDMLVLRMILDNDNRAVHFSRTAGNLVEELGLQAYAVTQGHSQKILSRPAQLGGDIVLVPGEGYVDVKRSAALWEEFKAPASLIRRGDWVDSPSRGIPFLIFNTGIITSEALARSGNQQKSDEILEVARQVAIATNFGDIFAQIAPQPTAPVPIPQGDTSVTQPVRVPR
jgi:hypothetical protein